MTEQNTVRHRAKPGTLAITEPVPFCRGWVHKGQCEIEHMLDPMYFASEAAALLPGDEIRLACIRGDRLREVARVAVVAINEKTREVELKQIGETLKIPAPKPADEAIQPEELRYVEAAGKVHGDAEQGFTVRAAGKIVCKVGDEEQANEIAKGNAPIPPKKK
jgi:hypothetical protein